MRIAFPRREKTVCGGGNGDAALRSRRRARSVRGNMEITLLGTGTSQGVPLIGHANDGLDLSEPKNWRNRSCAHIVSDGLHIQIDAGPEFRLACLKYGVPAVDVFFLTHEHSDHILGMDDLRRYCDLRDGRAIPVWTTRGGKKRIKDVFPYAIRAVSKYGYVALAPHIARKEFELKNGTCVRTTILPHGPHFKTLGMVFEEKSTGARLAYYTDCSAVPPAAVQIARGCDLLVIDALHQKPHPTHLCFADALSAAERIGAKKTIFTHMTYRVDYAHDSATLPPNVFLGYDGMRVVI